MNFFLYLFTEMHLNVEKQRRSVYQLGVCGGCVCVGGRGVYHHLYNAFYVIRPRRGNGHNSAENVLVREGRVRDEGRGKALFSSFLSRYIH